MLIRRMLCEYEGAPSSGAGAPAGGVPAASPAASPTPSPAASAPPAPRVPFVNPDLPPPASAPGGAQPPGAQGGQPPAQDNPIPYSRVREMIARERQAVAEQMRREFQAQPREMSSQEKLQIVRQALQLAGMEVPPEEAPPPPSAQDIRQYVDSRFNEIRQQQAVETEFQTGVRELSAAQAQFADYFQADPTLAARCQALWGSDGTKSMAQIVAEQVKVLDGYYGHRSSAYARQKAGDRNLAPIRPGNVTGGARAPQHDLSTQDGQDAALDEILDGVGL